MGLFSNPAQLNITQENTTDTKATFNVGGVFYKIWARLNHKMRGTDLGDNVWEMFFAKCEEGEDLVFGKHDTKLNVSGNAIKVYATVIDFLEYIGKTRNPDAAVFSVDSIKQRKMYMKLIKRYQDSGRLDKFSISGDGKILLITPSY